MSDSKSKFSSSDLKMEAEIQMGALKLLEFAATNDLIAFKSEAEERGCDVDEASFWYGRSFGSKKMGFEERTPIMIASLYGSTDVLKYILTTGKVDVNRACCSDGATALHCAAAGGAMESSEAVELLIAASGDTNVANANGKKPGDLIAPCVKSSTNSMRRKLEMLLNGSSNEEEGGKTPRGIIEKKEYPIDVSLPDINVGVYGSDEFRMYSFKVKPCSRAYSHDWTECPFVHPGENARRRDPRKYNYTCVPCPEFKKGSCGKADACEYAHGVFESWLHPAQYRTRLCKDETSCARKVCFFAHKTDELRPLYASTGSAMPSPKPSALELTSSLTPLSLGSSTPPGSPSVSSSSPMWQNKVMGSRLKTAFNARDLDLDLDLLGLDRIRTQQRQQLVDEMAGLSSPYRDLQPTNLDDVFGSLDPSIMSQLQGYSPKMNGSHSPTGLQIRQNMNQLRASYPLNHSSSPSRKPVSAYGFDSSAAVAAAVMNSRSAAFSKRSQSFIDRSGANYRYAPSSPTRMQPKLWEWGSPDGKLDWGFNGGQEVNKLRKSASFGIRGGNGAASPTMAAPGSVGGGAAGLYSSEQRQDTMPHWLDQMYIEQEQIVA